MSEVKRYSHNGLRGMLEHKAGRYVSYERYAALKAEFDVLVALTEERRQFIVNGVEMGDILLPVIDGDPATEIYKRCLLKPKFAFDAYLNLLRAEGVDKAIEHLHDRFDNTGHIGVPVMALESLASKLRAGKDTE